MDAQRTAILRRSSLLNLILLSGTLAAHSCSAEEADSTPGKLGDEGLEQWTRVGPIPNAPTRTNEQNPLSDQSNSQGWTFERSRSDEFNGNQLNPRLWSPVHRTWRGRAPALFVEENVRVTGGMLQLWMRKNGAPPGTDNPEYHTYTSAAVQARARSRYGYYEVRAKPMASAGSSSFWFSSNSNGWWTEIDVYELGGKAPGHEHRYNMNTHVFRRPGDKRHRNWGDSWETPFRLANDFHVYGIDWSPDRITYYVDGTPVRWVENAHWHEPLYLIFDSETMPDWLGLPEDGDLPSVYEIDYVRVWNRPSEGRATEKSRKIVRHPPEDSPP